MESNGQLELARTIIEKTGSSLFLTGKAGTGKTTFLKELRSTSRKRMIVTAPTGIAAINAGGVTLHSFFQLDFGPFIPNARRESGHRSMAFSREKIRIIRGLDLLVIDEVSMVRSDMLDAVDDVLRRFRDRTLPFGGVQLLLIGDLQQLPPVVVESERHLLEKHYRSPYFFDSHALGQLDYLTLELTHVYRQNDSDFLSLLNAVRDNRAGADVLARLNSRCNPGFNPPDSEGYVRLTTHNHLANEINRRRLEALSGPAFVFHAEIQGTFPENSYPADPSLELKEGAQVMFIKNDTGADRRFFNGMLGTVTAIDEEGVIVTPADGSDQINVEPVEWENIKFVVNEETKEITEQRDGVFRQLPLRTAWGITIHKSQGLTFDKAIIDIGGSFAHGQTYVALSRCRTLEGLVLERPLQPRAIINDPEIGTYLREHCSGTLDEASVDTLSHAYKLRLIEDLFNFRPIFNAAEGILRMMHENFSRLFPTQIDEFAELTREMQQNLNAVSDKFSLQLRSIDGEASGADENPRMQSRIKDGCKYFKKELERLVEAVGTLPREHDNRKVSQKLADRLELFDNMAGTRDVLLAAFASEDFSLERYLDLKAEGALRGRTRNRKKTRQQPVKSEMTADNLHPALFDKLCEWRRETAAEHGLPAYTIVSTRAIMAISNHLPTSYDELRLMPGVGEATIARYGDNMLDAVDEFIASGAEIVRIPLPHSKATRKSRKKK